MPVDNVARVAVGRREKIYRTQKALGLLHDRGLESETRVHSAIQRKLAATVYSTTRETLRIVSECGVFTVPVGGSARLKSRLKELFARS